MFDVALSEQEIAAVMANGLGDTAAVLPQNKVASLWGEIRAK